MFSTNALIVLALVQRDIVDSTGIIKSPCGSGYNHGCNDSRISDLSGRYIKQPEKSPGFHTE